MNLHNVLKTLFNPLGTITDTGFRRRNSSYCCNFQISYTESFLHPVKKSLALIFACRVARKNKYQENMPAFWKTQEKMNYKKHTQIILIIYY